MKNDLDARGSDDDLDGLLMAHLAAPAEELAPSSGFAVSVMEAIQQEVSEPAPIGFPWRRVVPGLVAVVCALAGFGVLVFRGGASGAAIGGGLPTVTSGEVILCSMVAAALLSGAAVAASFRLAGRNG
jgi:hypothetical protein